VAILEESGITVTPLEHPKTTMATPVTSTSILKPTHLHCADVVTTNPESRQIKTGKQNKADNRTSSKISTSMTGDNEDNDCDKDSDSDEDEGKDEDEDDHDDNDSKPKDCRELSGNSVGIVKGGSGGTYSNAATPITPASNEGDSDSGINNNNGRLWGGNNTTGTAGGPTTPLLLPPPLQLPVALPPPLPPPVMDPVNYCKYN
jgi:hypothetical protein